MFLTVDKIFTPFLDCGEMPHNKFRVQLSFYLKISLFNLELPSFFDHQKAE